MSISELSAEQREVKEGYEAIVAKMKLIAFQFFKKEKVFLLDEEIFDFLHFYVSKFFPDGVEIYYFNKSNEKGNKDDIFFLQINKVLQDNYRLLYPIIFVSLFLVCYSATSLLVHSYMSYFFALIIGSLVYSVIYSQFELEKKVTRIIKLLYFRAKKIKVSHWHKLTINVVEKKLVVGFLDDERFYRAKNLIDIHQILERGKPSKDVVVGFLFLHIFPMAPLYDLKFNSEKFLKDPSYMTNTVVIGTPQGRKKVDNLWEVLKYLV